MGHPSQHRFNDLLAQQDISAEHPQLVGPAPVATPLGHELHQSFAPDFGQIISGAAGWILVLPPSGSCPHGLGDLRGSEPFGLGGQSTERGDHQAVASFIEIQARQSSSAALARFGPALKLSRIQKTHVGGLQAGPVGRSS